MILGDVKIFIKNRRRETNTRDDLAVVSGRDLFFAISARCRIDRTDQLESPGVVALPLIISLASAAGEFTGRTPGKDGRPEIRMLMRVPRALRVSTSTVDYRLRALLTPPSSRLYNSRIMLCGRRRGSICVYVCMHVCMFVCESIWYLAYSRKKRN